MHPSASVSSAAFQVHFLWSRFGRKVFISFWNPTVAQPCPLMLHLLPRGKRKGQPEGMGGKWTIPMVHVERVGHPGELSPSVTCLAGLLLPAGPGLYKLARKSQGIPDVTPGFILKYHQSSPRQHTVFNMKSKYRILKVVAESDHCSGIAVTDTCGKFPK